MDCSSHIMADSHIYAIVLAGFFLFCAAISVLFVYDAGDIRISRKQQRASCIMKKFILIPFVFLSFFANGTK